MRENLSIMIWQSEAEDDKVNIFLCPFRLPVYDLVVLCCLVLSKWEVELDVKCLCRVVLSDSSHEVHSCLDDICSEFLLNLSWLQCIITWIFLLA